LSVYLKKEDKLEGKYSTIYTCIQITLSDG
jgi:hypothetical protein